MVKRNNKSEEDLQCAIVQWFKNKYPQYSKKIQGNALNGFFFGEVKTYGGRKQFVKNYKLLERIKKTGGTKDFPDIFIYIPRGGFHGMAIELKIPSNSPILKNGSYSKSDKYKAQLEYGLSLQEDGYFWEFGVGYEMTIDLIERYIENKIIRDE